MLVSMGCHSLAVYCCFQQYLDMCGIRQHHQKNDHESRVISLAQRGGKGARTGQNHPGWTDGLASQA